ncbi:hypothetical protein [Proteus mirabilis]|uniref:hypothetical protein n=2 Tax=Proteus mirabilis TaxID=584 RepID=UPI0019CF7295|nr:hypothetical protein [Proteus mirabilis]EKW7426523.1 hypothetical protein [Proteus mirabilis]MBN7226251.1 hypothetical protein [Proteus mirabilis]MBN7246652.1 hypothetical protein [Proteus mirabilis]MBN7261380.1 hypothetical protein [Proteus mirabilis]MBN7271593.1 hypothetical protein [Proteus mirabilis]
MLCKIKNNEFVDKLVAFSLMKGVQPEDLVTAIFEKEYTSIDVLKQNDEVYVIVSYKEHLEEDVGFNIISTRYTYNLDSQLQRVEQKINNTKYKTQWDRISKLKELISLACTNVGSSHELSTILDELLPNTIYKSITPYLKLVS